MRPTYETKANQLNEWRAAQWYARHEGLEPVKLQKYNPADYVLVTETRRVQQWVEVKCRTTPMGRYPTYFISQQKVAALHQLARDTTATVWLLVCWTDLVGRLQLPAPHTVAVDGRRDRNDPNDIEKVCHYALSQFEILGRRKGA